MSGPAPLQAQVAASFRTKEEIISQVKNLDREQRKLVLQAFKRGSFQGHDPQKDVKIDQACIYLLTKYGNKTSRHFLPVSIFLGIANRFFGRISSEKVADAILDYKNSIPTEWLSVREHSELFEDVKKSFSDDLTKFKEIPNDANKQLNDKIQKINDLIKNVSTLLSTFDSLNTQSSDDQILIEITRLLNQIKSKIKSVNINNSNDLIKIIDDITSDCPEYKNAKKLVFKLLSHLSDILKDLENESTSITKNLDREIGLMKTFESSTIAQLENINRLHSESSKTKEDILTKRNEIKTKSDKIKDKKQEIHEKTKEIHEKTKEIDKENYELLDYEKISNILTKINGYSTRVEMIDEIKAVLTLYSTPHFNSEKNKACFTETDFFNKLNILINELTPLSSLVNTNPTEDNSVENDTTIIDKVKQLNGDFIKSVTEKIKTKKEKIDKLTEEIASCKNAIESCNTEITTLTTEIQTIKSEMLRLNNKISSLENEIERLKNGKISTQTRSPLSSDSSTKPKNNPIPSSSPPLPVKQVSKVENNPLKVKLEEIAKDMESSSLDDGAKFTKFNNQIYLSNLQKKAIHGEFYVLIKDSPYIRKADIINDEIDHNLGESVFQNVDYYGTAVKPENSPFSPPVNFWELRARAIRAYAAKLS